MMPGPRLEGAVSSMAARARLYERMAHDRGPWGAIIHVSQLYTGAPLRVAYPMSLDRHECGDRVVLTGYLPVPAQGIVAADIWCRGEMLLSWPVSPPQDGPVRLCIELGVEDSQLAA